MHVTSIFKILYCEIVATYFLKVGHLTTNKEAAPRLCLCTRLNVIAYEQTLPSSRVNHTLYFFYGTVSYLCFVNNANG